jgi:type III secretory pathway component EscV
MCVTEIDRRFVNKHIKKKNCLIICEDYIVRGRRRREEVNTTDKQRGKERRYICVCVSDKNKNTYLCRFFLKGESKERKCTLLMIVNLFFLMFYGNDF